jgi:Domain of unknown function (DUF4864)
MPTLLRTLALWIGLLIAPLPAHAQAVSAADARGVRAVIEAQLAAFAGDDAPAAFAHASPEIRQMFGTPERFITMVREGYPVVYRPASVSFLKPQWADGDLVQHVHMADADGALWVVVYRMQRQADKSWRINGCVAARAQGRAA